MDDIVKELDGRLSYPVPRRIEGSCLEGREDGCDTIEVCVSVLELDSVKLGLEFFDSDLV